MNLAKKKPATWGSDGTKRNIINNCIANTNLSEKSNGSLVDIPEKSDLKVHNAVTIGGAIVGHRASPKNLKASYFHPENGNRKWRLIYVQMLIRHRYGSVLIPESDDTGYFEVVARNISNLNLFIDWCTSKAPWASPEYLVEIFNDTNNNQQKYDFGADKAAKLLNVQKDEYFDLKLGRGRIGYVGSTKKEREEDAKAFKRKLNKAQMMRTRRANGVKPRNEYLESVKSEKRWIEMHISESTYRRRKRKGLL